MKWITHVWKKEIGDELASGVSPLPLSRFGTVFRHLPSYRFVDLYNAIESKAPGSDEVRRIESTHGEDLNNLIHGRPRQWDSRRLTRAARVPWASGPGKEVFLPSDHFWVLRKSDTRVVSRLRWFPDDPVNAWLEVAAPDVAMAEAFVDEIVATANERSIYRGQIVQVSFDAASRDEYGNIETPEKFQVSFSKVETVSDEDLVIDDDARKILIRNVVDLHARREILKANRVPLRRGVLLHGPPGTGKTYACRYLCGRLGQTTRIMVSGSALMRVGQIFQLARLFQPSVLFLEDVDLVFTSREINLYSSVLGDLLDNMDGLRPFEDVGFVLTTNSIERMEAAVRDRPGRISQCIYFGPPTPGLRARYLSFYLRSHKHDGVDLEHLVRQSEGSTQAFLKEWVHRSVQIGSERLAQVSSRLELRTSDFDEALKEMKSYASGSTGRIIGFQS